MVRKVKPAVLGLAAASVLALGGTIVPAQAAAAAPARWHVVATIAIRKTAVMLDQVVAISARDAWTVGTAQTTGIPRPVVANWNGRSWRTKVLPVRARDALGRAFDFGIAGSSGANVWIYSGTGWAKWNGHRWLSGRFPVAVRHGTQQSGRLLVFSARAVWFVGEATVGAKQVPFARRYDGRRWHAMPAPRITGFQVSASSADAICAVNGNQGAATGSTTAMECWNGHRWNGVALPVSLNMQHAIIGSILVRSLRSVWIGGGSAEADGTVGLAAHWNGAKWTVGLLPAVTTLGVDVLNLLEPDGHGGLWADGECDCGGPA